MTENSLMDDSIEIKVEMDICPVVTPPPQEKLPPTSISKDHLCAECGKSYTQKRNLMRHRKEQHDTDNGPRFPCPQCDKKFILSVDMHSHLNSVHLKIKPFRCDICNKTLAHRRSLKPGRHSCKTKSDVFACSECGKVFKSRGSLRDHERLHKDSPPYSCKKCFTRFWHRIQLSRHNKKCLVENCALNS